MEVLAGSGLLDDIAVDEVVAGGTAQVQPPVGFLNLFTGNTDIVQSLSCRGVAHHLLEKQELPGVIVRHDHLMVSEGLSQGVSGHLDIEVEVFGNPFQNLVYSTTMQWLVR